MNASTLLRASRLEAGLSQHELARRSGMPQPSISRIERGVLSPTVHTLDRLLAECGMEVQAGPRPGQGVDTTLIEEWLSLTPGQRARRAALEWNQTKAFRRARSR